VSGTEFELAERSLAEALSYKSQQLRRNPRVRKQVLTKILDADYRNLGRLQSDHRRRPRGAVDGTQLAKYRARVKHRENNLSISTLTAHLDPARMQDDDLVSLVAFGKKDVTTEKMPSLGQTREVCRLRGTEGSQETPSG
jgi:hypothetical protein